MFRGVDYLDERFNVTSQDRVFFRNFLTVLGGLIALAIVIGWLVDGIVSTEAEKHGLDERAAALIAERIKPVGNVAVGTPPAQTAANAEPAKPAAPRDAATVVSTVCAGCHSAGILGAPKIGDKDSWAKAYAAGLETLVSNAINGKGAMPPRGGDMSLSDDEVRASVVQMLKDSGYTP